VPAARQVQSLRFDAGSLSLNLVATVGRRFSRPVERLDSVERLRAWLAGVGLDVRAAPTTEDLARFHRLREDLHDLFRHAVSGTSPRAAVVDRVNEAAAAFPRLSVAGDGLEPEALDGVIALIAADAVRILAGRDREELRVCEADDCRMLYLPHGRRARRWCSSEACGNRSRVAAHRARAALAS
jgi:predicted RNA-binding Zn ribbon-like protein